MGYLPSATAVPLQPLPTATTSDPLDDSSYKNGTVDLDNAEEFRFDVPGPLGFSTGPGFPVVIISVKVGSPAGALGIQRGSILCEINGKRLTDNSSKDILYELKSRPVRVRIAAPIRTIDMDLEAQKDQV